MNAPQRIPRRDVLIDDYWNGQLNDDQFADMAVNLGMEAHEIAQVMNDVREEDGVL